jgi:hypothetical protein
VRRVGVDYSDVTGVAQTLLGVGLSPADAAKAVAAFQSIPASAANAVLSMAQTPGGQPLSTDQSFGMAASVVAAGLAATGVGAPAAALVAAAFPIVEGIGKALGLFDQPPPNCAWHGILADEAQHGEQGVCVAPGTYRPYGPADPTWVRLASWLASGGMIETLAPYSGGLVLTYGPDVFPNPQWDHRLDGIWKAYKAVWMLNAERALNGHKTIDNYPLLQTIVNAWNGSHPGPSVTVNPNDPNPFGAILGGRIDGNRYPPLNINVGGARPVLNLSPAMLSPKKVIMPVHMKYMGPARSQPTGMVNPNAGLIYAYAYIGGAWVPQQTAWAPMSSLSNVSIANPGVWIGYYTTDLLWHPMAPS